MNCVDSKENIFIYFYTNINILLIFFIISKLSSVHKRNSWIQQNLWFLFTLFTLLVLLEFSGISKSGTLESLTHIHWGLPCDSRECQLINQCKPVLFMWPKWSFHWGNIIPVMAFSFPGHTFWTRLLLWHRAKTQILK